MSIVATRFPLEQIGMNGQKRRSARLSQEHEVEIDHPNKKSRPNGASSTTSTTTTSTKQGDGDTKRNTRNKTKMYGEKVDGFTFSKGKRKAVSKESTTKEPVVPVEEPTSRAPPALLGHPPAPVSAVPPALEEDVVPRAATNKTRRRLPTTPEREITDKSVRRSKRLSQETTTQLSPKAANQAQARANTDRSPTPEMVQPITVEKKRKQVGDRLEEEKTKRFILSFADTPIIQRNKQMRKGSGDGRRRSSSGMRGRRASSLIDEGRGNALPHPEVPTAEFFKHISAELTEPRRMRCLVGWCGSRALPAVPDPPKEDTPATNLEFRAFQATRMILEELSQDLMSKDVLNNWFGRDESEALPKPLRKKPNPRNLANMTKVEELERELERLKTEKAEWDAVIESATPPDPPPPTSLDGDGDGDGGLSPIRDQFLDSPQRAIIEKLRGPNAAPSTNSNAIQQRLRGIAENLEFTVDLFAHGIHTLNTARDTAERVANRTLAEAANVLEQRKQRSASGKPIDQMATLHRLAKVFDSRSRRP